MRVYESRVNWELRRRLLHGVANLNRGVDGIVGHLETTRFGDFVSAGQGRRTPRFGVQIATAASATHAWFGRTPVAVYARRRCRGSLNWTAMKCLTPSTPGATPLSISRM